MDKPVPQYPFPEPKPGNLRACHSCPCLTARVTDPVEVTNTSCSMSSFYLILPLVRVVLQLKTPARRAPTQTAPPFATPGNKTALAPLHANKCLLYLVACGSIAIPSINLSNVHLLVYLSCESRQAWKQDTKLPSTRPEAQCELWIPAFSHARPDVVSITTRCPVCLPPSTTTRRHYERVMETTRDPSLPTITPGFCPLLGPPIFCQLTDRKLVFVRGMPQQ
ncbi:uncharacterized protein LY79DRAFT_407649 [Colletotrichum navitas]|uniref:Uncharacterized protein n=1 Tax=Colletotrichum navitas TaxID=681940 RepID=A0AAD8V8S4_9PEZI|nr:uncharacterized protein LY79DRAFT_407649 [Colletotrichum navitas]KAK1597199.1 hypothetical protein LY79DRAFT_407649 [Colletotrichum navitas]